MGTQIDILFIDDQWCRPEDRNNIIAEYGPLQRREIPYVLHYETGGDEKGGYSVEAVMKKTETIPDLKAVILDIMFGDKGNRLGLDILRAIREKYPILPIFMMTSLTGEIETIISAMELGANEYLIKKPTLNEMELLLRTYTRQTSKDANYAMWGNSSATRNVRAMIARVSAAGASPSVLITGESGTGKELVARAIHRQGKRRRGPFVDKNCAYDDSSLLESDLFGHEKWSFTDARSQHFGRIERANEGVLFLDEIGSMPLELQGKLLRVLETKQFQRIGGKENINSDFQLISATNESLTDKIEKGIFRDDLCYRINKIVINVPPLRERKEDIPILINLFVKKFKEGEGASYKAALFSDEAVKAMVCYNWPGNIRELKNIVERSIILSTNATIDLEQLPPEISGLSGKKSGNIIYSYENILDMDPKNWPRQRLKAEIQVALEAKKRIQQYKGSGWKAEFMRLMYPLHKAQSGRGFNDLIRRLTDSAWSTPNFHEDKELKALMDELMK